MWVTITIFIIICCVVALFLAAYSVMERYHERYENDKRKSIGVTIPEEDQNEVFMKLLVTYCPCPICGYISLGCRETVGCLKAQYSMYGKIMRNFEWERIAYFRMLNEF